jgi:hypothetical protein
MIDNKITLVVGSGLGDIGIRYEDIIESDFPAIDSEIKDIKTDHE